MTKEKRKVWGMAVFSKVRDLRSFITKWKTDDTDVENVKHIGKNFRLLSIGEMRIPIALCISRNLEDLDDDNFNKLVDNFKKHFTYRELLVFSATRSSPVQIISQLSKIAAILDYEHAIIYNFLGISTPVELVQEPEITRDQRKPKKRKMPNPTVLPSLQKLKKHKVQEPTDDNSPTCCICMTNMPTEALSPCGHICLCSECADQAYHQEHSIEKCYICRTAVFGIQHTIFA
jgi:hypothetical protein